MNSLNRIALLYVGVFAGASLLASPSIAGDLADKLADAKDSGMVFTSTDLISTSVTLEDAPSQLLSIYRHAAEVLEHATFLTLDLEALEALSQAAPEALRLEVPFGEATNGRLSLELLKVDPFTPDFEVVTSSPEPSRNFFLGTHYRGMVAGDADSLAAVSVFADDLMVFADTRDHGLISVGALEGRSTGPRVHVAFADNHPNGFDARIECGFEDTNGLLGQSDLLGEITRLPNDRPRSMGAIEAAGDCIRIYLEADYSIYLSKGSTQATVNWLTGVFNQVATLYDIDNIEIGLSQVFVWNSSGPYTASSSEQLLSQFQGTRTSYNGNLAHLMKLGPIAGNAAGFNGICTTSSQSQSVAFVESSYSTVPTYSGTVFVVAHEIGHTAGSRHTHACVWNSNNTAIDGCAGFTEGSCALPWNPIDGGTIMSY